MASYSGACGMHVLAIACLLLAGNAEGAGPAFKPHRRSPVVRGLLLRKAPSRGLGGVLHGSSPSYSRLVATTTSLRGGSAVSDAAVQELLTRPDTALQLIMCRRLLLASFLGMLIGIERGSGGKPAGVRTMSLVAMGAGELGRNMTRRGALPLHAPNAPSHPDSSSTTLPDSPLPIRPTLTTAILHHPALFTSVGKLGFGGDGSRIAAQVASGVGFVGAGVIRIRQGDSSPRRTTWRGETMHNLKGITTACSIWVSAGIGVACGSGFGESGGG